MLFSVFILGFASVLGQQRQQRQSGQQQRRPQQGQQQQPQQQNGCSNPVVNMEWRELNGDQQRAYLEAVHCLRQSPSILSPNSAGTVWDDLVWIHIQGNNEIHGTAMFLPWHRMMLATHDHLMRTRCNYNGPFPYWDWTADSQAPERSPIWAESAFGGNGNGTCIANGRFSSQRAIVPEPHCINRRFQRRTNNGNMMSALYSPAQIQFIMDRIESYDAFRSAIETIPHDAVHVAVGGDMGAVESAPNDPVFYLHHRNIDRLWWVWQQQNPQLAVTYNGNRFTGQEGANDARSSDIMRMFGIAPDIPVQQVLNSRSGAAEGRICFTYSNSVIPVNARRRGNNGVVNQRGLVPRSLIHAFKRAYENGEWPPARPMSRAAESWYSNAPSHGSPQNPVTPGPYDRSDMYNIRYVEETPLDFLKSKGYSDERIRLIRAQEKQLRDFTDYVNSASGYVSHYSLGNMMDAEQNGWRSCTEEEFRLDISIRHMLCERAEIKIGRFQVNLEQIKNFLVNNFGETLNQLGVRVDKPLSSSPAQPEQQQPMGAPVPEKS